jgi:PNKP (polynucleotide 5'-kinase/3'-phosphatase) family adenylyltransferase-like protein
MARRSKPTRGRPGRVLNDGGPQAGGPCGGEGMVVKLLDFVARNAKGRVVQPALKCRGAGVPAHRLRPGVHRARAPGGAAGSPGAKRGAGHMRRRECRTDTGSSDRHPPRLSNC